MRTTGDAAEEMRLLEEDQPDVVVMDIRMPRMDGIEAIVWRLSRRNDLPVILNTAHESNKDDFRSWPGRAYVIQSSDLGEMERTIRKVIGRQSPRV